MTAQPRADNLKTTYQRWLDRRHPPECPDCKHIWGDQGPPDTFEDYAQRYPDLAHGAKRHLTVEWDPGLTVAEVASSIGCSQEHVREAIDNGMLEAREIGGVLHVTRTNVTRWKAAKAPAGDGARSWITLQGASERYGFTLEALQAMVDSGELSHRPGGADSGEGAVLVSRRQCGQLRDKVGYTVQEAAERLNVSVALIEEHLSQAGWRRSGELLPYETVRLLSRRLAEQRAGAQATQPGDEGLVSAKEAMAIASVSKATVYRWADEGLVPQVARQSGARYRDEDVRRQARVYWGAARRQGQTPPAWLAQEKPSKG